MLNRPKAATPTPGNGRTYLAVLCTLLVIASLFYLFTIAGVPVLRATALFSIVAAPLVIRRGRRSR